MAPNSSPEYRISLKKKSQLQYEFLLTLSLKLIRDVSNASPEFFLIQCGSLQNVCEIQVMPFSCHFFRLQPYASTTLKFYTHVVFFHI